MISVIPLNNIIVSFKLLSKQSYRVGQVYVTNQMIEFIERKLIKGVNGLVTQLLQPTPR